MEQTIQFKPKKSLILNDYFYWMKKRIFYFISRHRKSILLRKIIAFCRSIIKAFENWNNDHETNGEFEVLKRLSVFDLKILFDVGANTGVWVKAAEHYNPNSKIHAFEPIPDLFGRLHENSKKSSSLFLQQVGLGSENTEVDFYYYPNGPLFNSMFNNNIEGKKEVRRCQIRRGDDYCLENGIKQIDLIKIDVEGAEHLVINGFSDMIMDSRIKVIQFEYGRNNIFSKFLLKDYYSFFEQAGYKLGKIYPNYVDFTPYETNMENFIESNFLAVHENQLLWIEALSHYS